MADLRVGEGSELSQGDVFELRKLPIVCEVDGGDVRCRSIDCPDGVVLVNQSCDALRARRLQVAPIVRLSDAEVRLAASGRRPRYVPVRLRGEMLFADLEGITTVRRECLEGMGKSGSCLSTPDEERLARDLVSRRFGRFPFPNPVVEWCRPLQDKIAPKAKGEGNQGALLRKVTCIRIEEEGDWRGPLVYTLSLSFLVEPKTLPLVGDDEGFGCLPREIDGLLGVTKKAELPDKIADFILRADELGLSAATVCDLWQRMVDCWVGRCNEVYGGKGNIERVFGKGEVVSENEYTFDMYRRSEQLDLDYLSRETSE